MYGFKRTRIYASARFKSKVSHFDLEFFSRNSNKVTCKIHRNIYLQLCRKQLYIMRASTETRTNCWPYQTRYPVTPNVCILHKIVLHFYIR